MDGQMPGIGRQPSAGSAQGCPGEHVTHEGLIGYEERGTQQMFAELAQEGPG